MNEGSSRLVGVYELLEPLGKGGMGEVYRARDTRLGRLVAIKFLSAGLRDSPTAATRLDREARLASSLNHPGIVTVYDVGRFEDRPYVVMELIVGRSLAARLSSGPLALQEALDIGAQVADALAAAHDGGIVHRDLKPQNIMLTSDGRAKVVDFGLSKLAVLPSAPDEATRGAEPMTAPFTVLGTAGYMAPEQVAGLAADARADQFALGAIIYEMLTGRRAFQRDTSVQTLASIIEDEPPPLQTIRPEIPPEVVRIVSRCLAKKPEDRYAATRTLARDLQEVRDVHVAQSQSGFSGPAGPARRIGASIVVGILLTLLAAAAMVVWWFGPASPPVASMAQSAPPPVPRQIVVLPFANISNDADDQVLVDGLVETLTSSLTQLERFQRTLRVVPATEVRSARVTSAREGRQAFGAALAVSGSVQRGPTTVRLTLNLVDAAQQVQVASRTLDLALGEQHAAQDIVVGALTGLLDLELDPEQQHALTAGGIRVGAAYEAYIEGRGHLQRLDRLENVDRAISSFMRASTLDPAYTLAQASLGEAFWRKYELTKEPDWIERAIDHCARAVAIDSRLAPVQVTLALVARGRGRFEEALAVSQRAIEIDPASIDAHRELARAYEALGRVDDAEAAYRTAMKARPDDWLLYNSLGSFFLTRGRLEEAEAAYRRVTELTPDNTRGLNNLGATYARMGREDDAVRTWERSLAIRPTSAAASNLGTVQFRNGRYAEAARAFERATALTPGDHRLWRNLGASLYWAPGDRSKAASAFERVVTLAEEARKVNARDASLLAELADAHSMLGHVDQARAAAVAAERLGPTTPEVLFTIGLAYEQIHDRDRALQWVGKALAAGYPRAVLERSPSLAGLRTDARFRALVSAPSP